MIEYNFRVTTRSDRFTISNMNPNSVLPGLITSYSVTGAENDLNIWPDQCDHVEVYSFMKQRLPAMKTPETTVVQYLADLYDSNQTEIVVAEVLAQALGKKIVGFATFMPELTANTARLEDLENSQKALFILIEAVRALQTEGHPIKTVEIVGGSKVQRIFRSGKDFVAERLSAKASIQALVARLKPLAEKALRPKPVFLSVEVEPGPLYSLSDANSVEKFCKAIDESGSESLKRCIGLNLDIPHWAFLSDLDLRWLLAPERKFIRDRIAHMHICDHAKGHFADNIIGLFNDENVFREWIKFANQIKAEPRGEDFPEFSGFISCEMEACGKEELLRAGYEKFAQLIASC